jgi:hypothetical protein
MSELDLKSPSVQQPPLHPATTLSLQRSSPFCHPERRDLRCAIRAPRPYRPTISTNHPRSPHGSTIGRKESSNALIPWALTLAVGRSVFAALLSVRRGCGPSFSAHVRWGANMGRPPFPEPLGRPSSFKTYSRDTGYRHRGDIALRAPSRMYPGALGSGRRKLASNLRNALLRRLPEGSLSTWLL